MSPAKAAPKTKAAIAQEIRSRLTWHFKRSASDTYAALLAANRLEEAAQVADSLLKYVDTPGARAALVAKAMRAGQLEQRSTAHQKWLEEAWQ